MQDHSKPAESSWILLAAGFSLSDKWTLVSVQVGSGIAAAPKPPPKYHSFHKTVLQLQPGRSSVHFSHCAPGLGTPKLSVQYSGTPQLWRGLFFPSSMNHQWWHKVSPTGIMVQVGAVIPWELNSGSWCHQGKELQQPWSSSLCGGEQSVPQRGQWGKGLTQFMLCREEGRDHSCHLFFSFFHHLHFLLGKILVNNWIPEIEEWFHTHTPGRPLLVPQHHPPLVCFLKWLILSPFPKGGSACTQLCQIVLFSRDARQERKRSLLFSSLCIQGLPAWLLLFLQRGKDRIHCFCFSTGTIQLLFPMSQNTTDEHQHSELTKGQG